MGLHEQLASEPPEPAARVRPPGPRRQATPAEAVLALQVSAGNQSVQRYLTHPTWTRGSFGRPAAKAAEWTENDKDPKGEYRLTEDGQDYRWNKKRGKWTLVAVAEPEPVAVVEEKAEETVEAVPEPEPVAEEDAKPVGHFTDLGADSTLPLGGSMVPEAILGEVFGYLDAKSMVAMRLMDSYFRAYGSTALRNHLKPQLGEKLGAMSSLDTKKTLVKQYHDAIAERPPESVVVASDQVNENTVKEIFEGFPKAVTVYRGEHGKGADAKKDNVDYKTVEGPDHSATPDGPTDTKMHNKAVVGLGAEGKGQFLVSGSPNLTKSAMENNTESAAIVRFPGIAQMYKEYVDRIKGRTKEDAKFSDALKGFNESNPVGIRAALAPFVDIGETLKAELTGADEVTMRMYLVGSVKDDDPVDALCALAKSDPAVKVSVIVDRSQAESTPYIRAALEKLEKANVKVSTEKGKGGGIMHDKTIFAHYPKTETQDERHTVMIGSSGLTKHVVNNWNYENLLIIDDKSLFDSLQVHHKAAEAKGDRKPGIPAIPPNSPLGKCLTALNTVVGPPGSPRKPQADVKRLLVGRDQNAALKDAIGLAGMVKITDGSKVYIGYP